MGNQPTESATTFAPNEATALFCWQTVQMRTWGRSSTQVDHKENQRLPSLQHLLTVRELLLNIVSELPGNPVTLPHLFSVQVIYKRYQQVRLEILAAYLDRDQANNTITVKLKAINLLYNSNGKLRKQNYLVSTGYIGTPPVGISTEHWQGGTSQLSELPHMTLSQLFHKHSFTQQAHEPDNN